MGLRAALATASHQPVLAPELPRSARLAQTALPSQRSGSRRRQPRPTAETPSSGTRATAGGNADASTTQPRRVATAVRRGFVTVSLAVGAGGDGAAGGSANASADTLITQAQPWPREATGGAGGAGGLTNGTYRATRARAVSAGMRRPAPPPTTAGRRVRTPPREASAPGTSPRFFPNGIAISTARRPASATPTRRPSESGAFDGNRAQRLQRRPRVSDECAGDASATAEAGDSVAGHVRARRYRVPHRRGIRSARRCHGHCAKRRWPATSVARIMALAVSGGQRGRLTLSGHYTHVGGGRSAATGHESLRQLDPRLLDRHVGRERKPGCPDRCCLDLGLLSKCMLGTSGPRVMRRRVGCGVVVIKGLSGRARTGPRHREHRSRRYERREGFNSVFQNAQSLVSFTGGSEASAERVSIRPPCRTGIVVSSIEVSLALTTSDREPRRRKSTSRRSGAQRGSANVTGASARRRGMDRRESHALEVLARRPRVRARSVARGRAGGPVLLGLAQRLARPGRVRAAGPHPLVPRPLCDRGHRPAPSGASPRHGDRVRRDVLEHRRRPGSARRRGRASALRTPARGSERARASVQRFARGGERHTRLRVRPGVPQQSGPEPSPALPRWQARSPGSRSAARRRRASAASASSARAPARSSRATGSRRTGSRRA